MKEIEEFIMNATPKQLSKFIEALEQQTDRDFNGLVRSLKVVAFLEMLKSLKINKHVLNRTGKGFETHLHIDAETGMVLFISKKDSQNLEATYIRLYDMHKDKLLQIIDSKSCMLEVV
jgi:hypothetical protein